jgi:hypothetical protein
MASDWVTISEAAELYEKSVRTLERRLSDDELPPHDLDLGVRYWRRRDVMKHVKAIEKRGRWISWDRITSKSAA